MVLFGAVTLRLAYRLHLSTRPVRRTLGPVLAVACFRWAAYVVALVGRKVAPDSVIVQASLWLVAITLPIIAIAFLVGLARWWMFIAVSTQRLAARLHGHPAPAALRNALADVFDDPSLIVIHRQGDDYGYWTAATEERRIKPRSRRSRRVLTQVRDGDELVAAVIHDAALASDPAFIDTVTSYALMTLDNHRLSVETASLLREAQESRARIQAAADDERRRIERDLHDGAQQRLIALRIRLEVAAERTGNGCGGLERSAVTSTPRRRGPGVGERDLSREARRARPGRGIALRGAGPSAAHARRGSGGPSLFERDRERRVLRRVEALQNAAKHASGATAAVVELSDNGALHLEVRDDGGASTRRPWAPAPGS